MPRIKDKNVLVTGGAGFIGSHLCDQLLIADAAKVVCLDNFFLGKEENIAYAMQDERFKVYRDDARHYGVVEAIVTSEEIEIVFNMATIALNYSFFNPFDAYMVNVEIADTLLKLLKAGAYKTLIHISSSEAYGSARYAPMDENHPIDPTTPYAAGKAAADLMVQSFSKVMNLDIAIVRPFNNYGPRQNAEGPLAGIIPVTAKRIKNGKAPVIEGDGKQTRDFVFVKDTVKSIILTYENEKTRGEIINLGTGKDISMSHLVSKICEYMGFKGEWEYRPARTSDVRRLCANSSKAQKLIGYSPDTEFAKGLKATLDWYLSNDLI